MSRYEPIESMREFTKEVLRVHALNRAGLSTQDDVDRLVRRGDMARTDQQAANAERDRAGR